VAIIASWWYFICSCLFAFSWSLCQFVKGLLTKALLSFLKCQQSAMFTEYSIYWTAVDDPWVLIEVSWLKPSSALMKKSRWKLVVNRWHKMTFNQVIFLTYWQLICGRTNSSEVVEILPMSFISGCITGSKWFRVRLPLVFSGTEACAVSTI